MCGRYSLHAHPEVIALAFKLGLMPEIEPHYNIAPSTPILIVRDDQEKGRMQPYYIYPKDGELFGIAGISELWLGPDGPVHTCAIITTGPNELMKNIHDRMPVILEPEDYSAWLDPANQATAELQRLLKPCPAAAMAAHRVSPRVNTAKHDDPALMEPFESTT